MEYTDDDAAAASGDPHLLKLAYYDESAGEWVVLDTRVDIDAGIVCADTNHLSGWAIVAAISSASPTVWLWPVLTLLAALIVISAVIIFIRVIK